MLVPAVLLLAVVLLLVTMLLLVVVVVVLALTGISSAFEIFHFPPSLTSESVLRRVFPS